MHRVLVPGTFDPITLGHLDVIRRASDMFDEVIVGVAASTGKRGGTLFTLEERVELAREVTAELANVKVMGFDNLLVDFASSIGVTAVVKGLRATTDFEYEFQMAMLNFRPSPRSSPRYTVARRASSLPSWARPSPIVWDRMPRDLAP